LQFNKR